MNNGMQSLLNIVGASMMIDKLSQQAALKHGTPLHLYHRAEKVIKNIQDPAVRADVADTLHTYLVTDAHGTLWEKRDDERQWKASDDDVCDDLDEVHDFMKADY